MATSTIKPKCGTTAQWASSRRILEVNEWGVEVTESGKHILRIGDGEHTFHELPAVIDTPMLLQLAAQVEEQHGESAQSRDTAVSAAAQATAASTAATSALEGVQNALNNLPEGDTLIINDLSTGGTGAALSAEMGKVLAQRVNPNMFINANFRNPVNQKGRTEYTDPTYTLDGWRVAGSGTMTVSVTESGLSLTPRTLGRVFLQKVDTPLSSHKCCVSVLVQGEAGANLRFRRNGTVQGSNYTLTGGVDLFSRTMTVSNGDTIEFQPYTSDKTFVLVAAKLELGSVQTLAYQDADGNWVLNEIQNYGEELLKCQRYYQLFSSEEARPKNLADYRPVMRANPATGTININGVTYYYADANP